MLTTFQREVQTLYKHIYLTLTKKSLQVNFVSFLFVAFT